ncbi:phosphate ABC transporter permease subunit PstC [Nocardioides limicola]|uniref:phosphate ABC transporter permease subunit PstC n=1 Tax=Nocardioides limicola TaxID=2803368 RepID=UPI00193BA951|nr:phosphate ABC transporter permease subunit PstC [Nocardioides sp. DJM-14]
MSTTLSDVQDGETPPINLGPSSSRLGEKAIVGWLLLCASLSVLITVGIVAALLGDTIRFFQRVPLSEFFRVGQWAPWQGDFPVFNLVMGTLNITMYALIIAIPGGLGAAIWLSEYASNRTRKIVKPVIEVLEGVPTVAYGLFALLFIAPMLKSVWPTWLPGKLGQEPELQFAGAAALVMGVMLIPTIASISEDAMRAVPSGLRQAAYGLGSTKMQVALKVVVPAALSGIVAAFVLGISRGIGETMLVLMAAGATPNASLWPNDSVLTMTAFIARTAGGDISHGSTEYYTIFAVGSVLFVMTLGMNMIADFFVRRFRETYE